MLDTTTEERSKEFLPAIVYFVSHLYVLGGILQSNRLGFQFPFFRIFGLTEGLGLTAGWVMYVGLALTKSQHLVFRGEGIARDAFLLDICWFPSH